MSTYSPNEIAGLIYWSGDFGPGTGVTATDNHGNIVQHVPAPGSPERIRMETWLDTAIAICLAESGGDSMATNGAMKGLWQINTAVHQKEIQDAIVYWETELSLNSTKILDIYDARVNTYAAGLIYQQQGFKAWQSYTDPAANPRYRKFQGHGKSAYAYMTNADNLKAMRRRLLSNLKNDRSTEKITGDLVIGGNLSQLKGLPGSGILSGVLTFLSQGAVAVGAFVLALLLLGLGLWIIVSNSKTGKSAIKVASKLPI